MKIPSRRGKGGLKPLAMISVLSLVLVSVFTAAVFAENDYDTPGITDNSLGIWNASNQTPDGDLTYMFDGAGKYPGLIRHLLKDARSGHIYETRVKVYYQAPPAVVTVNTTGYANMCFFRRDSADTRMRMSIGSTIVYDQVAFSEGQRISSRTEYWKFDGNTGIRTLRTPPTDNNYRDRDASRVCEDVGGEAYTTTIYEERCGSRGGDSTCNGADTDNNFSLGDYNSSTRTDYNPAISSGCGGGTCRFGDRSFSAAWAPDGVNMGYDVGTGLYFALVNVSITGHNINNEDDPNQIRFKLNAPGSFAIGHQSNVVGTPGYSTKFGLGNRIVVGTAEPNRGVKLALPFGMSCSESATQRPMTIGLYDADRDTFANTYMYVVERDPETDARRRIPVTEFSSYTRAIPQTYRFIADTYTYDSDVSTVTFMAQKGMQYMFLVVNPGGQAGQAQEPGQNVFSVALPTDSIQGIVNCKYELQPMLDDVPQSFENTPNFRLHGYINNNRPGSVIGGVRPWQVTKLVLSSRPANYPLAVMNNASNPCDRMRAGNPSASPSCEVLNAQTYPTSSDYDRNPYTEAGSYPAGSYICFMTSVLQPRWNSAANEWAHSAMKCAVSVKFPSLGVSGGNVRTGGGFDTCQIGIASIPSNRRHQYFGIVGHNYSGNTQHNFINGAGIATGAIQNIATLTNGIGSGSANMRGHIARSTSLPANGLYYGDIANPVDVASLGTAALSTHCLPDVFASDRYDTTVVPSATPPSDVSPTPVTGQTRTYVYNLGAGGTLRLGSINLTTGQRLIVRAIGSGRVVLNGNITYSGSAGSIWQLPQFTLLADGPIDIVTADGVSRLDGIYAGKGDFYTCLTYQGSRWVAASQCTSELRVNGSVIVSGRLYPHRTLGHDNPTDTRTAERFDLRPDVLLSDYADSGTNPGLYITSQRELAPRY